MSCQIIYEGLLICVSYIHLFDLIHIFVVTKSQAVSLMVLTTEYLHLGTS
jgi:hypothetical protein